MIFDTHAHYDDKAFDGDREDVLSRLPGLGVGRVVDVGSTPGSLDRIVEIAGTHPHVYGALGLHPDEVGALTDGLMAKLEGLLSGLKIVAVGEIGLDYHWDVEPHEVQIRCFKAQALMAARHCLPIIVHSRAAAEDTLRTVQELYGPGGEALTAPGAVSGPDRTSGSRGAVPGPGGGSAARGAAGDPLAGRRGVIHAFAYSLEHAKLYTSLGFYLGIGGVVTYKNSKKLKKIVAEMPLERLLLETDCPYLTPEPHRGERNTSANLSYVAETIAALKGISREEVERVTWDNACRLFGL